MDFTALDRAELVATLGGMLLGLSLLLAWYSLGNRNAVLILSGSREGGVRRKPAGVL